MYRLGRLTLAVTLGALLAACHPSTPTASTGSNTATTSGPAKLAATADENTWGNYLAEQVKLHSKDVAMHPSMYVIPAGDSVTANGRRQNETDSMVHSIGPILMPGGMLIVGGPDPKQPPTFLGDVAKQLKADVLKGIVVMVVSDASEQPAVASALRASSATVRFVAM
ncbi:Uncharacterised protein [Burkholderia pseudomallei]|uniref:hypothetical protein n=1 Tax=Burkholderia pseudomallei TaxID=28450 RepID=UPI0005E1C41A|nr:hypothetical protein [Burkholderia pseudomallei]CAK0042271.1 Uncharacterised protein [Burkholderia pseudomallei]CFB52761.1 Uncharacterised protein [Burkholderia pseudomallei]CFD93181.1 Uncharacterised protein [Burkholderia pseudomallei]CFK82949.1 Uncharacterised protein [Burkholderia pseudomallei]CFK91889.1 Uncharacterised protein [Burkholderia pseudomallei]